MTSYDEWTTGGQYATGDSGDDQGPISVPEPEQTEEQKAYWEHQAQLGEQISQWEQYLRTELENASYAVQAADPATMDASAAHQLAAVLTEVAGQANAACSGLEDWTAAAQAFHAVEYWMHQGAQLATGMAELGGEQECHAQLSEIQQAVSAGQASLAQA